MKKVISKKIVSFMMVCCFLALSTGVCFAAEGSPNDGLQATPRGQICGECGGNVRYRTNMNYEGCVWCNHYIKVDGYCCGDCGIWIRLDRYYHNCGCSCAF